MQGAAKVGLFVVVFIGLLFGAYAVLGRSMFAPKTATYYADFRDAGGVAQGARILMAGVKVGTVTEITLLSAKQARLALALDEGVKVPAGTRVELQQSLLGFGDVPLMLVPPETQAVAYAKPGDVLQGSLVSPLQALLPESEATMKELNATLASARKLMSDEKLLSNFKDLLATSDRTVSQFGRLAANTNLVLVENRATLNRAMADAAQAISEVRKGIRLATDMLGDPRLKKDALAILDGLKSTGQKAELLVQNLNDFVTDPGLRGPLNQTVANFQTMSESGNRIAASTEKIAQNGEVISSKAIELADKANAIADEAHTALVKLQGFFEKVPSGDIMKGLQSRMDVVAELDPGRWRTDVDFSLPVKDFRIHAGLFDAFESNDLTLQIGKPFGLDSEYRYGVYAGKPGFGVDLRIAPNLYLRGDLFGLNETRVDLRARYEFGNDLVGWIGVNRAFDGNTPMVGIGLRR